MLGCVLAGGRSSRMGRPKASLTLDGEPLVDRACRLLSAVCSGVVVSGAIQASVYCSEQLSDQIPRRGPLGGIVTALHFAQHHSVDRVMFLPVDMPLLPASLMSVLSRRWARAFEYGALVCCAEADGIGQPLISAVHVKVAVHLERSLESGDSRVGPGLRIAAQRLVDDAGSSAPSFEQTIVGGDDPNRMSPDDWKPTPEEWALRSHWFRNVNTPDDFYEVEQALRSAVDRMRRVSE